MEFTAQFKGGRVRRSSRKDCDGDDDDVDDGMERMGIVALNMGDFFRVHLLTVYSFDESKLEQE